MPSRWPGSSFLKEYPCSKPSTGGFRSILVCSAGGACAFWTRSRSRIITCSIGVPTFLNSSVWACCWPVCGAHFSVFARIASEELAQDGLASHRQAFGVGRSFGAASGGLYASEELAQN